MKKIRTFNKNINLNLNFERMKQSFIGFIVILLIITFYFCTFLSPIMEKMGLTNRELVSLEETIKEKNYKAQELDRMIINQDELEASIKQKTEDLPEDLDSYDMIYLLSQADADTLNRRSLIFLETVLHGDYLCYPVRFSFSTNYEGLTDFLKAIAVLPIEPTISNMQISFSNRGNSLIAMEIDKEVSYDLDVELTLNFYVRGKGK